MTSSKVKPLKHKQIKVQLLKEINFLKNIFSVLPASLHNKGEHDMGFDMVQSSTEISPEKTTVRAHSIGELEDRLEKLKSQNKFNLKTKLVKKSLSSKLNKKIKKKERINKGQTKPKPDIEGGDIKPVKIKEELSKQNKKPVFNTDGKLVFSKFDFANIGNDKGHKQEKNPKKILENLKQQEEKFRQLEDEDGEKVKEVKEKVAWKNVLQKAEGQKIKDDPTLLKKSIKKMEQKKKKSKTQWDNRIQGVEQKKEERQKKRKENINKKKKEKKSKIVKAAVKRGRIVI